MSIHIPAGVYYLGDPCYAFQDDHANWLDSLKPVLADGPKPDTFIGRWQDTKWYVASTTKYGDGEYSDEQGRCYPVDAGLIGLIPKEFVTDVAFGMHEITLPTSAEFDYQDGTITIVGAAVSVTIPTGDDEDEDESVEWCYECEHSMSWCECSN